MIGFGALAGLSQMVIYANSAPPLISPCLMLHKETCAPCRLGQTVLGEGDNLFSTARAAVVRCAVRRAA